jgi:putative Holliday junction resolvase
MAYLGLDYGSKTVGVAICANDSRIATAKEIIRRDREDKLRRTLARVEELIAEYKAYDVVVGLPLMPDGDEGERASKARAFAEALKRRCDCRIIFWDERYTTTSAIDIMDECGIKKEERHEYVDMIAAQIILQSYLDENNKSGD